jgi:hypothetical protein
VFEKICMNLLTVLQKWYWTWQHYFKT